MEKDVEKYLPLFRKYRPQSFKDVVGQESLVKALSNAIELKKIANAYLFTGPRGTGKTSCARIFAKSLNCLNGPTLEPCQKCPSCLDITNASGLDVIEIDAATNRGIDDAKELIAQTQYAPMNGKYKIFIIDEVHMLSNEAFNALLKTFEEPPSNVIFILATTEPHKVIETIVSRCQRFDLRRITTDDIIKRLRKISDLENIKITDYALATIAKNVSGGLRDSLALLDQVSILGAREEITKEDIENLLGKVTFDVAFNFLNIILSKNVENALSEIDKIYDRGLEPKNFCENLIEFLRNLIFAMSSDNLENTLKFTNFNKGDIEKIKASNFNKDVIFAVLDKVINSYKEIRFATNPYLWAELMVINLCGAEKSAPEKQISKIQIQERQIAPQTQIQPVKETIAEPPVNTVIEPPVKTVAETSAKTIVEQPPQQKEEQSLSAPEILPAQNFSLNPVTAWGNVLNSIDSIPAKFFYSGVAKLVNIENKRVLLGFVNENVINQAKSDTKLKHLSKAISAVLGADYSPEFVLLTQDTKTFDVNIAPVVQQAPKTNYVKELPQEFDEEPKKTSNQIETKNPKTDENSKPKASNFDSYGQKTKEMLEAFNGKVID